MSDIPSPDFSGLEGGEEQAAEDAVQEVANWYIAQIITERRAAVPDEERIEQLKAGREAALADRVQLATAGTEEASQIAAGYAARLKELKES
ncbi:hypothetical protein [Streptomyces broussonetiae]|uniref:Uncharacterized protein n=1 Tax=Streptomyces broussonetiae TaxID=2686304 RepID=A0A6I6MXC1_9ACTN|nr:hypothetical protein [Streptomyces broussonetiae]QHA02260.1 hypothetical protein GQF42_02030 [Streptomyces broussonetiae]